MKLNELIVADFTIIAVSQRNFDSALPFEFKRFKTIRDYSRLK